MARRLGWVARVADATLFLWVAAFVVRYGSDTVWRELLFQAPLAAFSSLLFGI
jgi:hypothetical protein